MSDTALPAFKITPKRAKEIIDKMLYLTLATSSKDGRPWSTPVYMAFDENYIFYWGSDVNAQHSKNIAENNNVFFVIYDSTVAAGTGEGVYVKAKASLVTDKAEIEKAYKLLTTRRNPVPYWKFEDMQKKSPRLYKAVPEKIWVNAEGSVEGRYIDTRDEIIL